MADLLKVENVWMESHGRRIEYLMYELERISMSGSVANEINIPEIITMFKGAKMEIKRLQTELTKLQEIKTNVVPV